MVAVARVPLGATGIEVSRLGLGTVKLGRDRGVKYPVKIPTDAEAAALISGARDLGINLIDTAPAYGNSEERLGGLLNGQREEWVICTKVGEEFDGETSRHDFTPAWCRHSIERSLKRLRTDRLDIVLIHSDGNDRRIIEEDGTLAELLALKREGKILAVGISHKSVDGARMAIDAGADVIMATLNSEERDDSELIVDAASQGCGVLIKKALVSGAEQDPSTALAAVARHDGVHAIVVGTTNLAHLRANAAAIR